MEVDVKLNGGGNDSCPRPVYRRFPLLVSPSDLSLLPQMSVVSLHFFFIIIKVCGFFP
jgi:hypothetical protein